MSTRLIHSATLDRRDAEHKKALRWEPLDLLLYQQAIGRQLKGREPGHMTRVRNQTKKPSSRRVYRR